MDKFNHFYCERCGKCCCSLKKSALYASLDRGDGVCQYYNETTRLCNIYEKRPTLCNVDVYYDKYLQGTMSRDEYYDMNYRICEALKASEE